MNRIKNLDELLEPVLGTDYTYIQHRETAWNSANMDYSKLTVDVQIKNNKSGNYEHLSMFAKMLPPEKDLQNFLNLNETLRNEITFYTSIVPYFQQFQLDQGSTDLLDCFPKFYAARLSLNPLSADVDEDGVLLLQDTLSAGFGVCNRFVGCDLGTTQLVLTQLAKFHAVSLALKVLRTDAFDEEILVPFFEEQKLMFKHESPDFDELFERLVVMIEDDEFCMSYIHTIRKMFYDVIERIVTKRRNCMKTLREPFATIIHSVLWVNNILINCKGVKMVNLNSYEYGSLARDLLFFLFTSVEDSLVDQHYDFFVQLYYYELIKELAKLGCDAKMFGFSDFLDELRREAIDYVFINCLLMVNTLYVEKESDCYVVSGKQKQKCVFMVRQFIRRNLFY